MKLPLLSCVILSGWSSSENRPFTFGELIPFIHGFLVGEPLLRRLSRAIRVSSLDLVSSMSFSDICIFKVLLPLPPVCCLPSKLFSRRKEARMSLFLFTSLEG